MSASAPAKAYSYVRFSSALQASGDSLRRQSSLASKWCESNGVTLQEDYRDLGVSAFKGKNAATGALSAFIKSVETGHIPAGSLLLVESLDRITRSAMSDALALFLQIINAGIVIVTLADNRRYDRTTINEGLGELMMSLVILSRANEESATKSKRLKAAWESRRTRAAKEIIGGNSPLWLKLSPDGTRWIVDKARAKVVREIFTLAASGWSDARICRKLTERGIKTFKKGASVWQTRTIKLFLSNRATLGELATPKMPTPIPGYYPAILAPSEFAAAQRQRRAHPEWKGGAGENVFKGLLYTPDGKPFHFVGRKPYKYLMAYDPKTLRVVGKAWRYNEFLELFMLLCRRAGEMPAKAPQCAPTTREQEELSEVDGKIENVVLALEGGYSRTLEARLRDLEARRDALERAIRDAEAEATAGAVSASEIDWSDSDALAANLRGVVRRAIVDTERRSFEVFMLDGSAFSYQEENGEGVISSMDTLAANISGALIAR